MALATLVRLYGTRTADRLAWWLERRIEDNKDIFELWMSRYFADHPQQDAAVEPADLPLVGATDFEALNFDDDDMFDAKEVPDSPAIGRIHMEVSAEGICQYRAVAVVNGVRTNLGVYPSSKSAAATVRNVLKQGVA